TRTRRSAARAEAWRGPAAHATGGVGVPQTGMMRPVRDFFPEVAARECRTIVVNGNDVVPSGQYAFVEFFCPAAGCDCRNVQLNMHREGADGALGTINFALDPDGFRDLGLQRAFIDPLQHQTELASPLLRLFREYLEPDANYMARLERHYLMVKMAAAQASHRISSAGKRPRRRRRW
ncbi:MAG: hypothetical protein LC620_04000, partial [Halobacteriales archaeon]|nr:hypothetical protein [Halobacteriales archaeon]